MVLTFVLEDPETTDHGRSSSSPEAPLGRTVTGEARQRSARRIKCDEARPECRRCTVSRIVCRGYTVPDPAAPIGTRRDAGVEQKRDIRPRVVPPEIEPMDWEFQETIRYFFQVVEPDLSPEARRLGPDDLKDKNFPRHILYANVISDQLERASKARGRVLRPGDDPAFAASWAGYHRSVVDNIRTVNQLLRDDARYAGEAAPATLAILQLLISDLKAALFLWTAHLRGFLAYVEHRGGASAIMALPKPEKSRLSPILAFTMQINTHCPADQQIKGTDDFTDEEIRTLIDFDPSKVEPCPVEFHLARVRITRLRVALAGPRSPPEHAVVDAKVKAILDMLWNADLDGWVRDQYGDKSEALQDKARSLAPIYAVAIRLYGILTLPPSAVSAWAGSTAEARRRYPAVPGGGGGGGGVYEGLRRGHRDELLQMLREGWATITRKMWLAWPLTVVGVAVADDHAANRVFVDRCLLAIWRMPDVSNSSITALEKLRVFWLSGKTGWEDCFDEPIPSAV
ncbi:DUF300 domain-containing protein [Cordyceps javanica]|uniref:DUF300 domain-containing protein n=1 Tax=Cordyceps javanica TaxID=43265 RepID=A0A545W042_9HYPO|nr:DUF300 domain-containing protein [Cordyceps javanica]TQW07314.1 DUF300 domain protein [Cordyceps javanica]